MLIKKLFFSFCWLCVFSSTAQAAFPLVEQTLTAPRIETAILQEKMPCNR